MDTQPQASTGAAREALKYAALVFAGTLVLVVLYSGIDVAFGSKWHFEVEDALLEAGTAAMLTFLMSVAFLADSRKAMAALADVPVDNYSRRQSVSVTFFAAMEYHTLILNRSFVVFCCPDALYGWKFRDSVDASDPGYFYPVTTMLINNGVPSDLTAIRELANKKGGFIIPNSDIESVKYDPSSKWGMASIPHSGKLNLKLKNGKRRQFVLLGSVDGDELKEKIVAREATVSAS